VDAKALLTGASATSAGAMVRNDLYGPVTDLVPFREPTIMDLITVGTTESDTVEYVTVTSKTNSAATVAEATSGSDGAKPESAMALAVATTSVQTIAHWIAITKRAAADAGQIPRR
jgi:HK97 family phage major capsid protein